MNIIIFTVHFFVIIACGIRDHCGKGIIWHFDGHVSVAYFVVVVCWEKKFIGACLILLKKKKFDCAHYFDACCGFIIVFFDCVHC